MTELITIEESGGIRTLSRQRKIDMYGSCYDCQYDPSYKESKLGITCKLKNSKCEKGSHFSERKKVAPSNTSIGV
jgi:hypothetical protein